MPKVDILIKTDGTEATVQELEQSNGNAGLSAESNESITPNGTGGQRGIITRSVFAHQLVNAGIGAIKTTFMFAKSNYGNFTGDYLGQQKIDSVFSIATEMFSFGSNLVGGAIVGGPLGFVAGAVISSVNQGMSYGQAKFQENMYFSRANAQANYNAQRIGAILVNGNR